MKSKKTSILALSAIVAVLAVASMASIPESSASKTKTYEVTITNITPGQPLTPPLLVTHAKDTGIFTIGEMASYELQQLAENGDTSPLVAKLQADNSVHDIVQGTAPLVPANDPGNTGFSHSETFEITASGKMKFLSFSSMLICTNDGFAGIDTIKLPKEKITIFSKAYDARTEMNTEDFIDMVPPCQGLIGVNSDDAGTGTTNPAIAEDGIVIPHVGILGGEDLIEGVHGWGNPVVKIEIVRTD